jgi:GNAT superfamily N-acetyltransferase
VGRVELRVSDPGKNWESSLTRQAGGLLPSDFDMVCGMSFRVREATFEDAPAIAAVQVDSWRTAYRGIVPDSFLDAMTVTEQTSRWSGQLAKRDLLMYVALDGSGVFGFACGGALREAFGQYDAELYAIYLLQHKQRDGVGRDLVRRLSVGLREQGHRSLLVWVLEANPAVEFYERLGGVLEARKVISIGGSELPELAFGWPKLEELR